MVTSQQVLDEGGDALMFEAIEFGVFKEGNVTGAADTFYVAQGLNGYTFEFEEFGTRIIGEHGREL